MAIVYRIGGTVYLGEQGDPHSHKPLRTLFYAKVTRPEHVERLDKLIALANAAMDQTSAPDQKAVGCAEMFLLIPDPNEGSR